MPMFVLWLVACAVGGSRAEAPPQTELEAPTRPKTHWVERTDLELEAALQSACREAIGDGKLVLLEFSAPWCADCQKLATLKPQLADELDQHWVGVTAYVGKWDRHGLFRQAFGVEGIAWWVALEPTDCDAPPPDWPRRRAGVLELATGNSGPRTAKDVKLWLVEARSGTP